MPGKNIWTAGNDLAKEGQWMWAGNNQAFNYTQWSTIVDPEEGIVKQPDNKKGKEHCLVLSHQNNYEWDDKNCNEEFYYFICEYKIL